MACGQGLIELNILAKEEDKNEHHGAFIAAACAKPLASLTIMNEKLCQPQDTPLIGAFEDN